MKTKNYQIVKPYRDSSAGPLPRAPKPPTVQSAHPEQTQVLILLDKSASMGSRQVETVSAVNEQIGIHRASDSESLPVTLNLVDFNQGSYRVVWNKRARFVADIQSQDYRPSGMTRYYGTMGDAVSALRTQCAGNPNTSFLVIVISDGMDNIHDTTWNRQSITSLISELQSTGRWTFQYMGCDPAANEEAAMTGMPMMGWDARDNKDYTVKTGYIAGNTRAYHQERARGMAGCATGLMDLQSIRAHASQALAAERKAEAAIQ